jgi:hypothetical protein
LIVGDVIGSIKTSNVNECKMGLSGGGTPRRVKGEKDGRAIMRGVFYMRV